MNPLDLGQIPLHLLGTVLQGPQGPQGMDGRPGDTGPAGEPGRDGVDGAPGLPGINGRDGLPGTDGQPGLPGRDGVDGLPGAKGDKGDKGDQGDKGEKGAKGDKGDTGAKGATGSTGPANVLSIGTVVEGAAAATITGTAPAQALNLSIPRGSQGLQGLKGDTGAEGPRGLQGDQGIQGVQGLAGLHGWTPVFALVSDGARRVQQVTDWTGGTGTKPATGQYVGATGLVATAALAVDVRGPSGAGTGSVNPTGSIAANDLAAFADSTGQVIKALKAADLPVSTATQTALNGKAPLTGGGTSGTWPINVTGNAATAPWAGISGKPAVIASGIDMAAARASIEAVAVDEVITPFITVSSTTQPAVDGVQYGLANAAATTLMLPPDPEVGSLVFVVVLNGRSDNILGRSGSLIGGLAENMTINNPKRPFAAKFVGGTTGWIIL